MGHETITFAHLFAGGGPFGVSFSPLQHDNIDTGDAVPARCLKNGLWLVRDNRNVPYGVLLSPSPTFGQMAGVHEEVAVPKGENGAELSRESLRQLELKVGAGKTYRGRVISLECGRSCGPGGATVKVHRLHEVRRQEVILPESTLKLLDRRGQ
jgi:hypothetical protein